MKPVNYDKLSWQERRAVRIRYVVEQKGMCCYCNEPLNQQTTLSCKEINPKLFPEGFFDNPVHLHHNHVTGMTIGAVHCHCNAILWQFHGE